MSGTVEKRTTANDYRVPYANDWCAGCGDFGILTALQRALAALQLPPHQVAVFGGIGCSGKAQYYVNAYGISTLHGRVLPYATGAKLANPELTVVVVGGDGDGLAIGAGHFVNMGRRNLDLTYIMFNNEVYGLTKGQASPTLPLGLQTKSVPQATVQGKLNPLMLALVSGYTWIGRGYAFEIPALTALIRKAIEHPGLAFLEVLQPCPTYNDLHDKEWFGGGGTEDGKSRIYSLEDEGYDPVVAADADEAALLSRMTAFTERAHEGGDKIPTGVFLENRAVSTFESRIARRVKSYRSAPPSQREIADWEGRPTADLTALFDELAV